MKAKRFVQHNSWVWPLLGALVLFFAIGRLTTGISMGALLTNLTLASYLVIICLGQMTVITSGEGAIDLSVPYTIALAAYVSSITMAKTGVLVGAFVTLLLCAVIGVCIGCINLYLKVPAMITTLAVGYITYSGVLMLSTKHAGMPHKALVTFTQRVRVLGVSPAILLAVGIVVLMWVLLYQTKYGIRLHAVGQNRIAAHLAGISVHRIVMGAFIISSMLSGLAGILLGGYFGGAFQDMGKSYLLSSIAATVIGGTSVAGGKSSIAGVVSGAVLLVVLSTFLNVTRLPASSQKLIEGVLLILILIASVPKQQDAL